MSLFAEPIAVNSPDECIFYHALDLPQSGSVDGHWDLRGRFDDYIGHVDLNGKSVLDIGTASGFLTFEAEKRGANVVSVEAASTHYWQRLPFYQNVATTDRGKWEEKTEQHLNRIKKSYWLGHREFGSTAQVHYGNVYYLPEQLGMYDVAIIAQILVHLRDGIQAITSVAQRCKGTVIIAERVVLDERPFSNLLGRAANPQGDGGFWHHSLGFYKEVMGILGFEFIRASTDSYRCDIKEREAQITTLVFESIQGKDEDHTNHANAEVPVAQPQQQPVRLRSIPE